MIKYQKDGALRRPFSRQRQGSLPLYTRHNLWYNRINTHPCGKERLMKKKSGFAAGIALLSVSSAVCLQIMKRVGMRLRIQQDKKSNAESKK